MSTTPSSTSWIFSWWKPLQGLLQAALAIVLGKECAVCRQAWGVRPICDSCLKQLPFTRLRGAPENNMERVFWGDYAVKRANATFWFKPHSDWAKVVYDIKYHGRKDLAHFMGRIMALELYDTDFFEGVEAIVPVPITRQRFEKRGYNQSEELAKGIAKVIGVPVLTNVVMRYLEKPSQTTVTRSDRVENVAYAFALIDPEVLQGKRIIVVDDVITLGATLLSLIRTLEKVPGLTIHVMTLCAARHFRGGRLTEADLHLPNYKATFRPHEARRYSPPNITPKNSE